MKLGSFTIEQLSEGFFEIFEDGTIHKIQPTRFQEMRDHPDQAAQSSAIGIDPVFVTNGIHNIIIDCGLGWGLDHKSSYTDTSNVVSNLNIFETDPEKIDYVILTHLHYDHSAGSTFVGPGLKTMATFPNAVYIVHQLEWEHALSQVDVKSQTPGAQYNLDEMYKLVAEKRIRFISDDRQEVIPGVEIIHTGGHTPGHMVVKISSANEVAFYPGDLIPTEFHLNVMTPSQMDFDPVQSKKAKTVLLREAFNSGAVILFYHSLFRKSGKIGRDEEKNYVLLEHS